jgi:hypothetical protein
LRRHPQLAGVQPCQIEKIGNHAIHASEYHPHVRGSLSRLVLL